MGQGHSDAASSRAGWYTEQLILAGYGMEAPDASNQELGQLVQHMLKAWEASPLPTNAPERKTALALLSILTAGSAPDTKLWTADAREQNDAEGTWVPLLVRGVQSGVRVRVPVGTYDGDLGLRYNGRLGTVKAVRSGRAIVAYDNGDEGSHPPRELEGRY